MDQKVTLSDLSSGALQEVFDRELQKVIENINDPNTNYKTKREVVVKVVFLPNSNRSAADAIMTVTSKLAPVAPIQTVFLIAEDGSGRVMAAEYNKQAKGQTFLDQETGEIIDPIESRKKGYNKVVNMTNHKEV